MVYANAEINSRVASTLPIYFWSFASLILERRKDKREGMTDFAKFACLHNMVYLILNLILFPLESGFW